MLVRSAKKSQWGSDGLDGIQSVRRAPTYDHEIGFIVSIVLISDFRTVMMIALGVRMCDLLVFMSPSVFVCQYLMLIGR